MNVEIKTTKSITLTQDDVLFIVEQYVKKEYDFPENIKVDMRIRDSTWEGFNDSNNVPAFIEYVKISSES